MTVKLKKRLKKYKLGAITTALLGASILLVTGCGINNVNGISWNVSNRKLYVKTTDYLSGKSLELQKLNKDFDEVITANNITKFTPGTTTVVAAYQGDVLVSALLAFLHEHNITNVISNADAKKWDPNADVSINFLLTQKANIQLISQGSPYYPYSLHPWDFKYNFVPLFKDNFFPTFGSAVSFSFMNAKFHFLSQLSLTNPG